MSFEKLNISKFLLNAIEDLGFIEPTEIQNQTVNKILSGKDIIGVAQTGTGKTLAYLLPLLSMHKYSEERAPKILIIVPTRELVVQVVNEIEKLTTYMNIRYTGIYGGTNINTQKKKVYAGLDILVATPGRLLDLNLTGLLRLKNIKKLVIDEVDEMLSQGFKQQLNSILEIIPTKRQNLLFSATFSNTVEHVAKTFLINPEKIEITPQGTTLDNINQTVYHVPNFFTKVNTLAYLLSDVEVFNKVLIFVDSKRLADNLHIHLSKLVTDKIGVMHSNKAQNTRLNILSDFAESNVRILIATDIAGRGLDIYEVSHVINFDTPKIPGDYIHRIGRTGRANKKGEAITLVNEAEIEKIVAIEKFIKKAIEVIPLNEEIEISNIFTDDERPNLGDKNYLSNTALPVTGAAFHEKSEKNKKVNSRGDGFKTRERRTERKKNKYKKKK